MTLKLHTWICFLEVVCILVQICCSKRLVAHSDCASVWETWTRNWKPTLWFSQEFICFNPIQTQSSCERLLDFLELGGGLRGRPIRCHKHFCRNYNDNVKVCASNGTDTQNFKNDCQLCAQGCLKLKHGRKIYRKVHKRKCRAIVTTPATTILTSTAKTTSTRYQTEEMSALQEMFPSTSAARTITVSFLPDNRSNNRIDKTHAMNLTTTSRSNKSGSVERRPTPLRTSSGIVGTDAGENVTMISTLLDTQSKGSSPTTQTTLNLSKIISSQKSISLLVPEDLSTPSTLVTQHSSPSSSSTSLFSVGKNGHTPFSRSKSVFLTSPTTFPTTLKHITSTQYASTREVTYVAEEMSSSTIQPTKKTTPTILTSSGISSPSPTFSSSVKTNQFFPTELDFINSSTPMTITTNAQYSSTRQILSVAGKISSSIIPPTGKTTEGSVKENTTLKPLNSTQYVSTTEMLSVAVEISSSLIQPVEKATYLTISTTSAPQITLLRETTPTVLASSESAKDDTVFTEKATHEVLSHSDVMISHYTSTPRDTTVPTLNDTSETLSVSADITDSHSVSYESDLSSPELSNESSYIPFNREPQKVTKNETIYAAVVGQKNAQRTHSPYQSNVTTFNSGSGDANDGTHLCLRSAICRKNCKTRPDSRSEIKSIMEIRLCMEYETISCGSNIACFCEKLPKLPKWKSKKQKKKNKKDKKKKKG